MNIKNFLVIMGISAVLVGSALSTECHSAAFYFDNAATGANAGTSWSNAWESPGDIIWGGSGVGAGDTLYISGGTSSKIYTASSHAWFSIQASGTSDTNRVVVRIGQDAGHNGVAIFDGGLTYHAPIDISHQNWVTIDGTYNGDRHIKIQNTRVSQSFNPYALLQINGGYGMLIRGIEAETGEVGFEFLQMTDPGSPYYAVEVDNCYVHDIRAERGLRTQTSGGAPIDRYDVVWIHDSIFQVNNNGTGSAGMGPDAMLVGDGTTVSNCKIYGAVGPVIGTQHQDGIQWVTGRYFKIYNNTFTDLGNGVMRWDVLASMGDTMGYFHFVNNVSSLQNPDMDSLHRGLNGTWGNHGTSTLYDVVFANNTFVDYDKMGAFIFDVHSSITVDSLIIKNNLVYNNGIFMDIEGGQDCTEPGWEIDYNAINPGADGGSRILCNDVHFSQANSVKTVPAFVSYSYRDVTNDFHLATGDTTAIDTGTSMIGYFNEDHDGVVRPQGSGWDIGAYEYTGKRPMPPTDLTAE